MVEVKILDVKGKKVQGVRIPAPGGEGHPNMLIIQGEKGYIMCGYLNLGTSEAVGDVAAVIGGATFEDLLANPVKAISPEAEKLGIAVGMSGEQVVEIIA